MSESSNRYLIETVADISALKPEQHEPFLKDLAVWLEMQAAIKDLDIGITVNPTRMVWVDDGDWGVVSGVHWSTTQDRGK